MILQVPTDQTVGKSTHMQPIRLSCHPNQESIELIYTKVIVIKSVYLLEVIAYMSLLKQENYLFLHSFRFKYKT